jgi:hypothetical protein
MPGHEFIILGRQRSGTSVTHACLRGHPEVASHPEELHATLFRALPPSGLPPEESVEERRQAYRDVLAQLTRRSQDETRARGIKTAVYSEESSIDLVNCLQDYLPHAKVILVQREDLLAQYASLLIAERSGRWHRLEREERADPSELHIPLDEFLKYVRDCRASAAQFDRLRSSHQVLDFQYEVDIGQGIAHEKLFGFLQLTAIEPTWLGMRKISPPIESYLSNHVELREALNSIDALPSTEAEDRAQQRRSSEHLGDGSVFSLHRSTQLLDAGESRHAHQVLMRAIRQGIEGDEQVQKWAIQLLERALEEIGDVDLAEASLQDCEPGYSSNSEYLELRAKVARAKQEGS